MNIIVGKGSRREELVCDKAGQNISVSLKEGDFLHLGAIICPGCREICGDENCFETTSFNNREQTIIDNRDQKALEKESSTIEGSIDGALNNESIPINSTSEISLLSMVQSFDDKGDNENRNSKSFEFKDIPDSKVGVDDKLDCGGGGGGAFFNDFFDYFD